MHCGSLACSSPALLPPRPLCSSRLGGCVDTGALLVACSASSLPMITSHGSGGLGGDGAVAAWDGGSLGGDEAAAWRLRRRRSPSPHPLCSLLAHGHIARGASRSSSPVIHVSPSRSSSRSSSTAAWRLHRCRIPSPHLLCSLLAHGHVARGASRSSLVVHASPSRSSSRSSSTTAWRLHQRRSPSPRPLCSLLTHGHIARGA
jgi:hypothetical protein